MKIEGGVSSCMIRASLKGENETLDCIGNVLAKPDCWSFLKGGFTLSTPSNLSILYFEVTGGFFFFIRNCIHKLELCFCDCLIAFVELV